MLSLSYFSRLSLVVARGSYSSLQCSAFSLPCFSYCKIQPLEAGLQKLWHVNSVLVTCGFQRMSPVVVVHGFKYLVKCGIFLRSGIEPLIPAFADGFREILFVCFRFCSLLHLGHYAGHATFFTSGHTA